MAAGADLPALRADLARICKAGFEYQQSRHFVGLVDLCCPVLDGDGLCRGEHHHGLPEAQKARKTR